MMMNKKPQPPLAAIERKFSVFPDVDSDAEIEYIDKQDDSDNTKPIPDAIKALIKRRCEILKYDFNPTPHAGQIVLIDAQTVLQQNPTSSSDFYLNDPLLVLLDSIEDNDSHWKGWLVAQETDYAGHWDMCLDPKLDAPLDPLVGMVQIWNQVILHTDFIERVVGELKRERLAHIDEVAQNYQQNDHPSKAEFASDYPRYRYQQLYQQAAHFLSNAAKAMTVEKIPAPLLLNQWLQPLFLQAEAIKCSIVPRVNYAMGDGLEKEHENDLLLNQSLRIQASKKMLNDGKGYLVKMTIRLENQQSTSRYAIEFFEDDNLDHYFELSTSEPVTNFMCHPKKGENVEDESERELVIRDEDNNIVHRFFL